MPIMYHPQNPERPCSLFAKGWKYAYAATVGEIERYITRYRTATAIWKNQTRKKTNFMFAEWICVDVDQGLSLENAKKQVANYVHLIGTTRSHGKEKKDATDPSQTIVCDRYRVYLRLMSRVTDIDMYEATGKRWCKVFQGDSSGALASQMMRPVTQIVSKKFYGKAIVPYADYELIEKKKKKFISRDRSLNEHYAPGKILPGWAENVLRYGCAWNSRDKVIYMLGRDAKKIGLTEDEILARIANSRIPGCGDKPFDVEKARRTIRSAYNG